MNIGNINFNIESIETCISSLKDEELIEMMSRYNESTEQILTTLSVPISFMAHGLRKSKAYHFSMQDAMLTVMKDGLAEKDPKRTAQELVSYFENLLKRNEENVINDASTEIELLISQVPILKESYSNLGLNAIINSWTIFEAYSKNLWIHCLNKYPKKFLFNLLNSKIDSENEIEGISGKNISIGLLAKYDFNVSKNLGDLLYAKYDFTGVRGIKKAYKDLFGLKDVELAAFENQNLSQFEITRHLFVHNAGVIDIDYLRRTNKTGEKINEKININADEAGHLINSGIETIKELFIIADKKINYS